MTKDKWVWMPHAGRLYVSNWCRFHLNTRVGKYIVSTVGEYVPDAPIREIYAESRKKHLEGMGDARLADYMKKIGYEEIGFGRTYETMVFPASKSKDGCCPWVARFGEEKETCGYTNAADAYSGHMRLCQKWAKKN